jgi:hypothetical protein
MVQGAVFNSGGEQSTHYLPGAFSRLKYIKGTGGLVSSSNACFLGDCRGGKPNELLVFGSPAEAEEILRSGPLLDSVKHSFSPGGGLTPQRIGAIRVNPGTQATRVYQETAETMITATAWDYGLHTNQLKSKFEAGTTSGHKITTSFQNNDEEVFDNVERESISIQYTGSDTVGTIEITKTALITTDDSGVDLNLLFTIYPKIEDLVNYINDQANYTCSLIGLSTHKSSHLDSVTAGTDIKTSAVTLNSDLQAIIETMISSAWIFTATFNTSAGAREVPDYDASWVYFGGAVDGAYTTTEWTASLTYAENQNIQLIGTPAEDSATHAMIKTHCNSMNSVTGKNERQFIVGGASGETVAQIGARAIALTTEFGALASPEFKHYDFDDLSKTKTWSPAYYAAKLIGMNVALSLNEPVTFKNVDVLSFEKTFTIPETEELIKNGVMVGIKHRRSGQLITARGVTTYQGSELQKNEFSMMREALFVSRDLREAVESSFVGKAMSNNLLGGVDAIVYGKLSTYYDMGLFNGDPPYWGYVKTVLGDQIKIEYDANLTPPTNFIFVTSHMHVYASTT